MNSSTTQPILCNCTNDSNLGCQIQLRQILNRINAQLSNEYRTSPEKLANADLYSIVILCLFAAIIIVIMIRAIKPSESLDDQVTGMLTSMRARCDYEEDVRHKIQLQKAKLKAKRWLNEAKMKSAFQIRKLSFRSRSTGPNSVKSQVISHVTIPVKVSCHRAASMQFLPEILPEIVVTSSKVEDDNNVDSSPQSSRQPSSSRASSTQSLDDISQESYALDTFMDV